MQFFAAAINVLQMLVIAIGAGLGVWVGSTCWKVMVTITLAHEARALNSLWPAVGLP